jgi:hypothetical protein
MKSFIFIALTLFILGCSQAEVSSKPSCSSPFVPYKQGCCLDKDINGICDIFEEPVKKPAVSEVKVDSKKEQEAVSEPIPDCVEITIKYVREFLDCQSSPFLQSSSCDMVEKVVKKETKEVCDEEILDYCTGRPYEWHCPIIEKEV